MWFIQQGCKEKTAGSVISAKQILLYNRCKIVHTHTHTHMSASPSSIIWYWLKLGSRWGVLWFDVALAILEPNFHQHEISSIVNVNIKYQREIIK